MGGEEVRVEEAGGMDDGSIGTDAVRVQAAIERAMSGDGVLVLMDLGSALMSAEMAVELMEGDGRVVLERGSTGGGGRGRGGRCARRVRPWMRCGRGGAGVCGEAGSAQGSRPKARRAGSS